MNKVNQLVRAYLIYDELRGVKSSGLLVFAKSEAKAKKAACPFLYAKGTDPYDVKMLWLKHQPRAFRYKREFKPLPQVITGLSSNVFYSLYVEAMALRGKECECTE